MKTELADTPTQLLNHAPSHAARWLQRGVLVSLAVAAAVAGSGAAPQSVDPETGLAEVLAASGISVSPSDVHWIDGAPAWWAPWGCARAWVLGGRPGAMDDVYLTFARRTPEGAVLGLSQVFNISDTRLAAEQELAAHNHRAAWVSGTGEELLRLHHVNLDLSPLTHESAQDFTALQRWQWRLAWLQQSGVLEGISHRSFRLVPPVSRAFLAFNAEELRLTTAEGRTSFTPDGEPNTGGQFVAEHRSGVAPPGNLVTWTVDRVRHFSWFGDENMQRLKAVAYMGFDWLQRKLGAGNPDTGPVVVAVSDEDQQSEVPARQPGRFVVNSRAWPPPQVDPLLPGPQPNEGRWLSLNSDPFIKPTTDPLGLFYTTFLRTDPEREFSRILITAWDPLTVDLHMMSGTEEPKSATGETGSGMVPRTPEIAENFVAAFNGGFQATHGDFGMMVEGTVYVPPLPYAATVAKDTNGRVGFGTWPTDVAIPDYLASFRQNLTPLVADEKYNPYGRSWWGGVPSGWEDDTRTVRSGLCVTVEGLIAYFYGAKVDAEHLAKAMLAVKCRYGLHLDMNQGHTGLEFYHVARTETLPPLALNLDSMWQAEGEVSETSGLRFRGRRMFRSMQLMNFPRFIRREARDFFYLTARPLLPENGAGNSLQWTVPPMASETFPYPIATSHQQPDPDRRGTRVNLVQFDPQLLSASEQTTTIHSLISLPQPQPVKHELGLWWHDEKATLNARAPAPEAHLIASGQTQPDGAQAAFCIRPGSAHVLYAEVATGADPSRDGALLTRVVNEWGCRGPVLYWGQASEFVMGDRDLSGHPASPSGPRVRLSYRAPTRTFRLFPDTPVVPEAVWRPLQRAR